jgi:hypothetical protein
MEQSFRGEEYRPMSTKVFPMLQGPSSALWVFSGIISFLLLLAVFFGFLAFSMRLIRCEVDSRGMHIRGGLYGRFIRGGSIDVEGVRVLDLKRDVDFQPKIRKNGIGMPGLKQGWFRLRNKEKALLFVTDGSQVVYVPTNEGYSILFSTPEPEKFARYVREIWR